jgi:DnaJ-class molecular chaperone
MYFKTDTKKLYDLLEIHFSATEEEIKIAFEKKM